MGTYISDITRTWPVNGKFSGPQRDLYNAVLNVNRSCVSLCRESAGISLDRLHSIAESSLKDQLKQLEFDVSGDVCATILSLGQADLAGNEHSFPTPPGTLRRARRA